MHTKRQLTDMKLEHDQWQGRLRFYSDELSHFHNHLGKLSGTGKARDVMSAMSDFYRRFSSKEEELNTIRSDFSRHENLIDSLDRGMTAEPDGGIRKMHNVQRDKLDQFERMFHNLRNEFNLFLNRVDEG